MAAYRRVDGFKSPVGWLPVHRDQLRAQCSVTRVILHNCTSVQTTKQFLVFASEMQTKHCSYSMDGECKVNSLITQFTWQTFDTPSSHSWLMTSCSWVRQEQRTCWSVCRASVSRLRRQSRYVSPCGKVVSLRCWISRCTDAVNITILISNAQTAKWQQKSLQH